MANKTRGDRRAALMTLQQGEAESGVPYTSLRDLALKEHGPIPRVQVGDSTRIWIRRRDFERLINGQEVA